jgi:hypothetical protein
MLAALVVAVVTGCTSSARTAVGPTRTAHPATVTANRPTPYALYTHCGINDAKIGGRWFEADHPLSDGSGNPPPGWGNPFQQGTIKILSATAAEFRDGLGNVVRFHLHPGSGAAGPKQVCALYHRAARQLQRSRVSSSAGPEGTPAAIHGARRCAPDG